MSDETPPPSLRLKPRQRPEGAPPATPAAPAAGSSEPESGKIRLKPKLTPEPAPAESAAVAEPEPVREKIRLKPQTPAEPAAAPAPAAAEPPPPEPAGEAEAPAPEPPKVKLKIKIPGALTEATAAAAAAEPAPEVSAPSGKVPPPFPVVATPGSETAPAPGPVLTRPGMPGKPGVPGRNSGPPIRRLPPGAMAASARRKKFLKAILVALGGVAVAAGMIALAISKFINPQPPSRVPKPREVVTTPFVETPTSIPEEVVPEPTHKQKSKSGVTTTSATTDLAPGVTVTSEDVVAEIEASQSFRSFVADAKISGVFQGTPPRAFINGRLIRVGETVDSSLGIRFESIDPKTKNIVFKDTSGATVSRRY